MEKLRMCVACREMHDKNQLVRVVKDKVGNISIDETGKKNGRGAYVCKNEECFKKLTKTKGLNKAFKCLVDDEIYKRLEEEIVGNK